MITYKDGTTGPFLKWEEWLAANPDQVDYFGDQIDTIRTPDWHGAFHKGTSAYDFSGQNLQGFSVYNAFAEAVNFRGSTLTDLRFEEGDFSRADFSDCTFRNVRFNKTMMTGAVFAGASFFNCSLNRVNLTGADFRVTAIRDTVVYGISAWDLETDENSIQENLIIERTYDLYSDLIAAEQIPMAVDNIELAQFIYFLTNHQRMRDTINVLNDRGVLLLGRFKNGGLQRLYQLRDWFRANGYLPMIFDFDRPNAQNFTETVVTMSGLSKMVVADLSGSSVPRELTALLTSFKQKPIIAYHDDRPFAMFKDLEFDHPYVRFFPFDGSDANLLQQLPEWVQAADQQYEELLGRLAERYRRRT